MVIKTNARERLIKSAIELMMAKGYHAVSVNEICSHAHVVKGSFYHYFPAKWDILREVIKARDKFYQELFYRALAADISPLAKIRRIFELACQDQQSVMEATGKVTGCTIGNLTLELSYADEPARQIFRQLLGNYAAIISQTLKQSMDMGEIPRRPVAPIAQAIFAYLQGVILLAKAENKPQLLEQLADGAISIAHGLKEDPS
ncbi:MAG: TetR/AcrR family transcriptional regulator [Candidatus Marinimicrobia bacterium]|nr:TetR/AcrR family transcriptional regulator [Candidatus Neomarinimicrobiota bacterium]